MLQLPDLSPFSFSFNFCFQLCLLYAAIHDLWNKALFSGKTSASVDLFCRALYLLFKAFGQPSKLRNSLELSAIVWNKLFSGSKPEKQILRVKHKFPITDFAFSSLKISKNNMKFLYIQYLDLALSFAFSRVTQTRLNWYNRNDRPIITTIMTN